ncbi:ACR3 family arsenite efflux transporter [Thorsellia anophelis]|uniref:Arsenite transporter, ACR3 family n=1 Tax=Thorsellia anophelis DSM 18579 TaxID=1123402 RepID=A0A1I0G2X3_9GAMM|nr:ACR3 family arsenite efflux transporter [Thorsellia anophelis]SET64953.1 arsenite transporter, ACR3 family [Thorsellia anophelis DSM 18579]
MGLFERYLSVWVGFAILIGIGLGVVSPASFVFLASIEYAHVNLIVAVLIWLMIYPMMVQIDFSAIKDVGKKPKGLILTLVINWLIKPFSMAFLGWLFFKVFFANWVDPQSANEYIAGMILLGVAPCTAMVFVWSQLTKGDANYTLVQVSVNNLVMLFAFAPIAGFLLGISNITVPWDTLLISVLLYVLTPLVFGYLTRKHFDASGNQAGLVGFNRRVKPFSIMGLLATVVLLFGFQANTILSEPLAIVLISIPLLILHSAVQKMIN